MTKEAFIQTILEKISQSGGNGRVEIREMIKRNGDKKWKINMT